MFTLIRTSPSQTEQDVSLSLRKAAGATVIRRRVVACDVALEAEKAESYEAFSAVEDAPAIPSE